MTDFQTGGKLQVGDKVRLTGEVKRCSTVLGYPWVSVDFGEGPFVFDPTVINIELVERPNSPGQRAYEAWASDMHNCSWDRLLPSRREYWEKVARAARADK